MSTDTKEAVPAPTKEEIPAAMEEDSKLASAPVENGNAKPAPMLVEKRAVLSEEPDDDDDDDKVGKNVDEEEEEEGAKEEDELFTALEHTEEEREAKAPHETPVDKALAPTLLKSALETGAIKSEGDGDEKKVDQEVVGEDKDKAAAAGDQSRVSTPITAGWWENILMLRVLRWSLEGEG